MTNLPLLPQEAARELQIRRKARSSILHYANAIDVPGKPVTEDPDTDFFQPIETSLADHHRLLLNAAADCTATPHGRLMIFMPPGSAKSTYASVVVPSWYLGKEQERKLIVASYGDDLTRKMGRRTRAIIRQSRYQGIWGAQLNDGTAAAQDFALSNGSEYMACGILGGVTGNRAHGIIIDDPVKGREAAESPTIRQKTFDAYQDDLLTRLVPGGWVILIQTRWHQDDLAGKILPPGWDGKSGPIKCRDGNTWNVICLQARCEVDDDPLGRERGDYLWPEWFDRQHWAQFEHKTRTWNSLYQQRPSPLAGDIFKPDKIQVVDAEPSGVRWIRGWDFGSTSDPDGDPSAGAKLGIMPDGRYIVGHVFRDWFGPDDRDAVIASLASQDGRSTHIGIPQDPGQAGKTQVLYLTRQLKGFAVKSSPESGDKVTRAEPFAAQVNVGNVAMVRGAWNSDLIEEMREFPNGKHDDQVDALSRAFGELIKKRTSYFG